MAKKTFEEALARLEEIAQAMEKEDIGLEESVKLYKEGVELASFCTKKIENAQNTVKTLKESSENVFTLGVFNA
ncbi:MAG: exodeoxyribonuclease VII small subunit [Firmicutes bacterium]|nr:exodeoxyribonuclease VII small subunit [Bacillota bacterium]